MREREKRMDRVDDLLRNTESLTLKIEDAELKQVISNLLNTAIEEYQCSKKRRIMKYVYQICIICALVASYSVFNRLPRYINFQPLLPIGYHEALRESLYRDIEYGIAISCVTGILILMANLFLHYKIDKKQMWKRSLLIAALCTAIILITLLIGVFTIRECY